MANDDGTTERQRPPVTVEEIEEAAGGGIGEATEQLMARTEAYHYDPLNEMGEETWSAAGEKTPSTGGYSGGSSVGVEMLPAAPERLVHIWEYQPTASTTTSTQQEPIVPSLTSLNDSVNSGGSQSVGDDYIFEDAVSLRKGSAEFCRICHETGGTECFISPCSCRGSLSLVHKSCLERWLAESDSSHCELCGYQYRTQRLPKHGLLTSIFAWLTSTTTWRDRRNLFIDFVALCVISPLVGLATMLALQLADSLFSTEIEKHQDMNDQSNNKFSLQLVSSMVSRLGQMGVISMVITMDMAYISWVAMRIQFHVTKWYTWYRRNCKVTLVGYQEVKLQKSSAEQPSEMKTVSSTSLRAVTF